jgi:hypothetical protein
MPNHNRGATLPAGSDAPLAGRKGSGRVRQFPVFLNRPVRKLSRSGEPGREPDESLIVDPRGQLSPAEMVERKLFVLLKGKSVPLSHLRLAPLPRSRSLG